MADLNFEQELAKPLKNTVIISIIIMTIGFGLLFLDDLFTLYYGSIKYIAMLFALTLSFFTFVILLNSSEENDFEDIIGSLVVSVLFALASTLFAYSSFNLIHKYVAEVKPTTFTLVKQTQDGYEFDQWTSAFGNISCQWSEEPEGSEFVLNINSFMTVKRFKMGDICLADERKAEQQSP